LSLNNIWRIASREMRWTGLVMHMRENRNRYRILMGKPEVKRPHARTVPPPRHL